MSNLEIYLNLLKGEYADAFYLRNKEKLDELAFLIGAEQQDTENSHVNN